MSVIRTFTVTVANPGAGNRYYIDGVLQETVNLAEGYTYKFDQSAGSNGDILLNFLQQVMEHMAVGVNILPV